MNAYAFDETGERFHLIKVSNQVQNEVETKEAEINRSFNRKVNIFCWTILLIFFLLLSILACPTIMNDEQELSPCALGITISAGVLGGLSVVLYIVLICQRWRQLNQVRT